MSGGEQRPWTPGPWEVASEDGDTMFVADESCYIVSGRLPDGGHATDDDLALIALAPEMAELLLSLDNMGQVALSRVDELRALAERLRRIGGDA